MNRRTIKGRICAVLDAATTRRRARYRSKKKSKLKNHTPSIICNTCVGGQIYNDLGLQFQSPTVNTLIKKNDFFRFVNDLESYLSSELAEVFEEGCSYPIGSLQHGGETVRIHFPHDTSFEEAKRKWVRRAARVDFDNIYILYDCDRIRKNSTGYKEFKNIKYKNKRMLTFPVLFFDREVVPLFVYLFKRRTRGRILLYPNKYSVRRRLDAFDYVSFLNQP